MPIVELLTTPTLHKKVLRLMGNRFEISVMAADPDIATNCIETAIIEIQRIEKLFTTFNETSTTCKINAAAGISPVKVEPEVLELIKRCLKFSEITQGSFDITYGSLD